MSARKIGNRESAGYWMPRSLASKSAQDAVFAAAPDGAFLGYRTDIGDYVHKIGTRAVFRARMVNVRDFEDASGNIGDAELQAAVDYCIANKKRLWIPSGTYTMADTLKVGYGATTASVIIVAEKLSYTISGVLAGAVLDGSALDDRPIVNVQGARAVKIYGLAVQGPNDCSTTAADPSGDVTDWYDTGEFGQYNPQCGFSVDAFCGTDPGGGNGYPNDAYSRASSVQVDFVDCFTFNNIVGYMIKPANDDTDASSVTLSHCRGSMNAHAFANGCAQALNTTLDGCNFDGFHTGVDTVTFGKQHGSCPNVRGGTWSDGFQLFNATVETDAIKIFGHHADAICKIGNVAATAEVAPFPVVFEGCVYSLQQAGWSAWKPAVHLFVGGSVKFSACYIYMDTVGIFNAVVAAGRVAFDSTQFATPASWGDQLYVVEVADGVYSDADNCSFADGSLYTVDTSKSFNTDSYEATNPTRIPFAYRSRTISDWNGRYELRPPFAGNAIQANASSFSWTTTTVQFTTTDTSLFQVGDILYWQVDTSAIPDPSYQQRLPMLRVATVAGGGATITCDLLFERTEYDTLYTTVEIVPRLWAARDPLIGTFVTDSPDVDTGSVDPNTVLKVGDFIRCNMANDWLRVIALDYSGGIGTITMNTPALVSGDSQIWWGTRVPFGQLLKKKTPTDGGTDITVSDIAVHKVFESTLTGSRNAVINASTGEEYVRWFWRITQGGSGSYTITWPSNVVWPAGSAPTLSTGVGEVDIIEFLSNGTTHYGRVFGQDMS